MVSAGQVCGTHGSGIVYSAADVLWMSMVRGMRGVGGVCEMCMCLARSGVCGEGGSVDERIGLWIYLSCGNSGCVGRVSVFRLRWCGWCGWCRWGVCRELGPGSGGVVLCLCEL